MAVKAYVLINAKSGKIPNLVKALSKIGQVKTVHPCWGRPDIFAYVEVENQKALSDLVFSKIHSLDGVESTDTRLIIEF
jgi:DNA-binding Lrp family transcriptional regulator